MAACCYFGVDLRKQLDHRFPYHSTDGTPHSSSDLPSSFLLLPFTGTIFSKSNSLSSFSSLGQFLCQSKSCSLFSFRKQQHSKSKLLFLFALYGQKILSPNPNSKKIFPDNLVSCVSRKFTSILQKYAQSNFHSDSKKFLLFILFTHSIPLPLESKQCSLTAVPVLACVDSVDELRFWSKGE